MGESHSEYNILAGAVNVIVNRGPKRGACPAQVALLDGDVHKWGQLSFSSSGADAAGTVGFEL